MDCMFLQNGFLLEKTKQLSSGQVYTVQLDWINPPTKRPDLRVESSHSGSFETVWGLQVIAPFIPSSTYQDGRSDMKF